MKKYLIIFSLVATGILVYALIPSLTGHNKIFLSTGESKMLPRVLFLTTGLNEGNGELSGGVIVAIQRFNKRGAFVRLETRDVLLQPEFLSGYSLMVVPTSIGYHDGDKKYSLTYMSDVEMENIAAWVKKGGVLIAEENIGRNTMEEADRADLYGELNPKTWKLSEVFGIKMKERDLNGFSIEEKGEKIWNGRVKEPLTENEWVLIPTEIISDKIKVLAEWVNEEDKIPAIIENDFGKGKAYLLTSTYLLHPSNDGGVSGIDQIGNFYDYVLNNFSDQKKIICEVNPWPNAHSSAFCISFNSIGNPDEYSRISRFLTGEKLSSTFFCDSSLTDDEKKILDDNKSITLQSDLYSRQDFSAAGYSEIARQFLLNEQKYKRTFSGLRFPYYSTGFWGLIYAGDHGYIYDSSLGVDHLTSYTGSVFPYNIPVSHDSYYRALNLLELCPVRNDDIFYFGKAEKEKDYSDDLQKTDEQLFEKYLLDFNDYVIEKDNGLMIYQGHPKYTGFSDITLQPLKKITDTLRVKNCWMTTLDEVAAYRNQLQDLSVNVSETDNGINLKINLSGQTAIKNLTFKLNLKPLSITMNNKYDLKEINGSYFLITDVRNGDEINLTVK